MNLVLEMYDVAEIVGVALHELLGHGSGTLLYELLCATPLSRNGYVLGVVLMALAVVFSYALTHLFSGRGAFIHMGAVIGTIMAGNVFLMRSTPPRSLVTRSEDGTVIRTREVHGHGMGI